MFAWLILTAADLSIHLVHAGSGREQKRIGLIEKRNLCKSLTWLEWV